MTALRQFLILAGAVALMVVPALMLGGCAGAPHIDKAPPPPQIVTVDHVVRAPCIDAKDMPAPPALGLSLDGDAKHDADILAARVNQLWAVIDRMFALSTGCTR